ncbi:hypothetical protein [Novosphingobium album (ex Liu et al. 2023)]|uniref:DUF4189 domain-containing protein n=1 Tax=Novosphingobium album (ex Liu et al. 2023) TaxID=3031130 RepID=A0ABT5WQ75_9SPHN|nr:hypothetical protein [Novosphingobium album (ex Liu et al. 2023)]MDE8651432.1 hypothetical protein [Novosphingobium album (ex Liu et al. 2023)]
MLAAKKKASLFILVGAGVGIGATLGALGFAIADHLQNAAPRPAEQEKQAAVPAPPARWMLTYNGSIVLGEKFKTETECERARGQYVQATVARARATIQETWGKGYTGYERPYYEADVARGQTLIREAEAAYCQSYSL